MALPESEVEYMKQIISQWEENTGHEPLSVRYYIDDENAIEIKLGQKCYGWRFLDLISKIRFSFQVKIKDDQLCIIIF